MHRHQRFEEISSDDFCRAKFRWDVFWLNQVPNYHYHWMDFEYFLGAKRLRWTPTMMLRRSAARKIKLLNSDHYHAMLMAYKGRKELQ